MNDIGNGVQVDRYSLSKRRS